MAIDPGQLAILLGAAIWLAEKIAGYRGYTGETLNDGYPNRRRLMAGEWPVDLYSSGSSELSVEPFC
jgi:hypothetical protein